MTTDIENMLGADRGRRPVNRGPLHDVLTRALPDFRNTARGENICDLTRLAEALEMSKQGVYKWFRSGRKNQIPPTQVDRIVEMSKNQKTGGVDFKPATREDFWEFLPR